MKHDIQFEFNNNLSSLAIKCFIMSIKSTESGRNKTNFLGPKNVFVKRLCYITKLAYSENCLIFPKLFQFPFNNQNACLIENS